jgi:branched-subunit amino acid ABC-type transport system permease component
VTGLSVILALAGMLHFTRVGNRIRAVASNPQLACTVGIRTDLVISGVFVLANVMVVLAGILMACDTGLTPSMGFRPFMLGVVAAILGGVGSTMGSLVAGLFIGLAQNIAVLWVPTQWQDAIVFLILVAFLLLRPAGLLGKQPTGVIATV